MRIVCFDTNVMIWGVKGQASSSQIHMIDRTKRFIADLEYKGDKVLLPTPVIAEFLISIDESLHSHTIATLQRSFIIQPFDLVAAAFFAKIGSGKRLIQSRNYSLRESQERN